MKDTPRIYRLDPVHVCECGSIEFYVKAKTQKYYSFTTGPFGYVRGFHAPKDTETAEFTCKQCKKKTTKQIHLYDLFCGKKKVSTS